MLEKKEERYENGKLKAVWYEDELGRKQNMFKSYHKNGMIEEIGHFKNNEKNSWFSYYNENGKLRLEGQYLEGKKEGNWEEFNEAGSTIYKYSKGELKVKEEYNKEDSLVEVIEYGKEKNIVKNYSLNKLDSIEEHFHDEVQTKKFYDKEWNLKREISKVEMKSYYDKGGLKLKIEMKGTLFSGSWERYYPNGQLAEKHFYKEENKISFKEGKSTYYNENGQKEKEEIYKKDKLVLEVKFLKETQKHTLYYSNGQKYKEGEYNKDFEKVGIWKEYNKDGSLRKEEVYEKVEKEQAKNRVRSRSRCRSGNER